VSLLGLFERTVFAEIGPEGGPGLRLADLRISFKVEHKASSTPSTATIRIFNPAPASIALLRAPLATIRLLVGYGGIPKVIFQGPPTKDGIDIRTDGPDRILQVDASDGGRGYQTFLQVSFATPTTFGAVLATVLAQTQWARGFIDPSLEGVALPHGIVLVGRPEAVMKRLAAAVRPVAADWFVRDNALYVVGRGSSSPEIAPLLSSTQGNLIGSPTSTKDGVKLKALIDATMRPGRAFVVQSLGVNGTFICKDVVFEGDSGFGNDFYMRITGKPIGMP
jgi:hypothetical protein